MSREQQILEKRREMLAELPDYDVDDINPDLVAMRLKIILAPIPEDNGSDELALFPKDYFKKDDNGDDKGKDPTPTERTREVSFW